MKSMKVPQLLSAILAVVFTATSCSAPCLLRVTNKRKETNTALYIKRAIVGNFGQGKIVPIEEGATMNYPVVQSRTIGIDLLLIQISASRITRADRIRFTEKRCDADEQQRTEFTYEFPEEYKAYLERWSHRTYLSRLICRYGGRLELRQDGSAVLVHKGKSYILSNIDTDK